MHNLPCPASQRCAALQRRPACPAIHSLPFFSVSFKTSSVLTARLAPLLPLGIFLSSCALRPYPFVYRYPTAISPRASELACNNHPRHATGFQQSSVAFRGSLHSIPFYYRCLFPRSCFLTTTQLDSHRRLCDIFPTTALPSTASTINFIEKSCSLQQARLLAFPEAR